MATHELRRWREEKNAAWLYRILSDCESGNPRQLLFLELAKDADEQADLWANEIRKSRAMPPVGYSPGFRVKLVAWLICRLGPQRIKPVLTAMKMRGLSVYSGRRVATDHLVSALDEGADARHPDVGQSGDARGVVSGVSDGLVSIFLLVLGVAGATEETATILLIGVAGLLAGAFLMAIGEWILRREAIESRIGPERDKPAQFQIEEIRELALVYQARGVGQDESYKQAILMIDEAELGLDTPAQEAPDLNPATLSPPWQAAMFSFFAFIFGGLIPLMPFLLEVRHRPLLMAVLFSSVALFAVGAMLSLVGGRQALWGGLRMLLIGGVAGAISYSLGGLLGAKVS